MSRCLQPALFVVLFLCIACACAENNGAGKDSVQEGAAAAAADDNQTEEPTSADEATAKPAPAPKPNLDALPDHPIVWMETTKGVIVLELDNVKAPISTKNFLKYVESGYYNGTIFHRVMPDFMIQGGGFPEALYDNAWAQPKTPRSPIKNEAMNGLSNKKGTIAMARTNAVHSATSQFFINVVDNARLDYRSPRPRDYGYAVFGTVIEGMDVVEEIRFTPTKKWGQHQNLPTEVIRIDSVKLVGGK